MRRVALLLFGASCGRVGFEPIDATDTRGADSLVAPVAPTLVSGPGNHTCVIRAGGRLRCWGYNILAQLGLGHTMSIGDDETAASGDVPVGEPVVQVALGFHHTCALLASGNVRCWGDNMYGELGLGNGDPQPIGDNEPASAAAFAQIGAPVEQLTAGGEFSCARLTTGAVRCWGIMGGYLGTVNIGDDEPAGSGGDAAIGDRVMRISSGDQHTCAVLESGAVRCWGFSSFGQLGYGNTARVGDDETPASAGDVAVGDTVEQIAAGSRHTCAVLPTGRVRCWGNNDSGQLGYGHTQLIGDTETPASAGDVDVGGPVAAIGVGFFHTCALMMTGVVRCWGLAADGQLGYGNTQNIGDDELPSSAGDVPLGGRAIAIAVGGRHTCAMLDTDQVRCWGQGAFGQLGNGTVASIGDDEPASASALVPLD